MSQTRSKTQKHSANIGVFDLTSQVQSFGRRFVATSRLPLSPSWAMARALLQGMTRRANASIGSEVHTGAPDIVRLRPSGCSR